MQIPTQNLSNGFISEILELFKISNNTPCNDVLLVHDRFLYTLLYDKKSNYFELTSFLAVKDFSEDYQSYLKSMMKNYNPRIDFNFESYPDRDTEISIIFKYNLNDRNYIEDIEILNLHNLFESFLYEANMICREICIRRRIKELDSIDI